MMRPSYFLGFESVSTIRSASSELSTSAPSKSPARSPILFRMDSGRARLPSATCDSSATRICITSVYRDHNLHGRQIPHSLHPRTNTLILRKSISLKTNHIQQTIPRPSHLTSSAPRGTTVKQPKHAESHGHHSRSNTIKSGFSRPGI